ncbi:MAG: 1-deoxy-D-xylulose-5-phosphate reductoisomerase [Treponema sp.]|jgi:1-deoxy-D-xylulose-5-phosphate reductoisomerase|nr:1-deoxy-D-xylulose-5-phosphate reductoisomerase [Treponema sp.]
MKKRVAVFGATGSIGRNTLDVIRKSQLEPALFSSHSNEEELVKLGEEFPRALLVLTGCENTGVRIPFAGKEGLRKAISSCGADIAVNGIAGSAGLYPSVWALEAGMDLALANKETVVMAGPLVLELAEKKGARILPVDSEHSAIFQLIQAHGVEKLEKVLLTASGGPFRNTSPEEMKKISAAKALAHPTWKMGPKISIDSATLANKGLEVIEAVRLFAVPPETIEVVIHPQSVVHSMIRLKDGAVYAQLSNPDMRLPIAEALFQPAMPPSPFGKLDFENLHLDFARPDPERFPMLPLAFKTSGLGGLYPSAYNAANEAAVAAFLGGHIGFLDIYPVVRYVVEREWNRELTSLELVFEGDTRARELANTYIRERFQN